MINFNNYFHKTIKVILKNKEVIFGKIASVGGIEPMSNNTEPNSYHCWILKFKNEEYLIKDNLEDSKEISLNGDDVEEIQIIKN